MVGVDQSEKMFEVTLPKMILRLLSGLFILLSIILFVISKVQESVMSGMLVVCIVLFALGIVFLVMPCLWKVEVYETHFVVHKLWRVKTISFENVKKVRINLTNDIEFWDENKRIFKVDAECMGNKELIELFKSRNVEIVEVE